MISAILVGALVLLALYAAMAPLESLRWWSRAGAAEVEATVAEILGAEAEHAASERRVYVVYLSGIGVVDGTANARKEMAVLAAVQEALPDVVVAADVFPYSVTNQGLLTGQRVTTWLWTRLRAIRRRHPAFVVHYLINARNVFQMFVSADARYGPTYNAGMAQEIWRSLGRQGYARSSGSPVVLVGYSGGGQVALGAAWYLGMAGLDVSVISIGGMLSNDPGLDRVRHLWHFYGSKDNVQSLGAVMFPGRWPSATVSFWNKAVREGRISMAELGPMIHYGRGDYFDSKVELPGGGSPADATTAAIVRAIRELESLTHQQPTAPA